MQTMPGNRGAGRRGLHLADDRGRAELQGASAVAGAIPRVQEVDGKGVTGDTTPNPAWRVKSRVGIGGR